MDPETGTTEPYQTGETVLWRGELYSVWAWGPRPGTLWLHQDGNHPDLVLVTEVRKTFEVTP